VGTKHSELSRYLEREVEKLGGQCQPLDPRGHVGRCDRFAVFHHGPTHIFYFVEVKTEGDTVKSWQALEHERLRAAGYDVRVLWGREDIDGFIRMVKHRLGQ
jgi:hypothetical protein